MGEHYTRDEDLRIIQMVCEGFTSEGVSKKIGRPENGIIQRLGVLGAGFKKIRVMHRSGLSPDQILAQMPYYKPAEKKVEAQASQDAEIGDASIKAISAKLDEALKILASIEQLLRPKDRVAGLSFPPRISQWSEQ